ncbi:MAG: DNA-binding transcriptional LysR family regulator [Polyangiales bacterium]|jgi:DNA-binding transcriptional LysR family regulator
MINADWLVAFVAFAEEESFTAAARRLHISQPALHVQVRKLSEQVGVPLYTRDGRGVKLTMHGEALLAFGRDQGERTRELLARLRGEDPTQPIALSAGEGAYLYLLGDALRRFNKRFPERLRLLTHDQGETLDAVRSGRAHVGVTMVEDVPPELIAEPLQEVGAVVVVPRSHRLAKKRSVRIADLAGEHWVVPPKGKAQRVMLDRTFRDQGVPFSTSVEANGWELILHFAKLGLGLAIVNECCKVPAGMVGIPMPELPAVPYYLVRSRRNLSRPSLDVLCDLIRAGVAKG